jgi:hypothetical protein
MLSLQTELIQSIGDVLEEALTRGAAQRKLFKTHERLRGIGKTTALVKFAKKHGLYAVVATREQAILLRKTLRYKYVFTTKELQHYKKKPVVIDECVDKSEVERLGFEVITGYLYETEQKQLPEKLRVLLTIG